MRVILSDAIMDNEHTESRGKKRSKFNANHLAEIDHSPHPGLRWAAQAPVLKLTYHHTYVKQSRML